MTNGKETPSPNVTPRKPRKTKTTTEPTVSDTSVSPSRDTGSEIRKLTIPSREPIKAGKRKFSDDEHKFIVHQFFETRNLHEIQRRFVSEFGKSISVERIRQMRNSKWFQEIMTAFRAKHDTMINLDPLSSVRSRIKVLSDIVDICMDKWRESEKLTWLYCASLQVMRINQILVPDKKEINVLQINQGNTYTTLNLNEIREKKLELLKALERVKLKDGGEDHAQTIEASEVHQEGE